MKNLPYKPEKKDIDFLEYWRIIVKRKWVLITFCLFLVLGSAIISFTTTPLYRATASILIDEPGSSLINIQDILNYGGYYRPDYLGTYYNTQLRLLTSRSLAERVAKRLNLGQRPEFQIQKLEKAGSSETIKNIITLRWLRSKKVQTQATSTSARQTGAHAARYSSPESAFALYILGGLRVLPVEETRLVLVSFVSPDPILAADIVNTLVEEFVMYSVETRYETTKQTSEFLGEQIADLRQELKQKEEELQKYSQEKRLLYLDNKESTVINKFADVSAAYTEAQIDRFKKEAVYRELRSLNIDALPDSVNNQSIQSLKSAYSAAKSEYEEKSKFYRQDYPEMIRLKARLDSTKNALEEELQKAIKTAEADYRSALKKENSLFSLLEGERSDVVKMNNNAILYRSLQIEVENMRNLLSTLVARQNEIQVSSQLSGLRTSNIKIIDKALMPVAPFTPNTKRNLIVALLLGLFGGVALVFFVEYLDNTVKDPDEVEKIIGLPTLGTIPYLSPAGHRRKMAPTGYGIYSDEQEPPSEAMPDICEIELINYLYPNFAIAEDYRTLRTSILFSHADSTPKTICFTSTMPMEGKTVTVANLAVSFAQLEGKVLVVDADLRKPRLHKVFSNKNLFGLSDYLTGKVTFDEVIQKTSIENIWILTSGPSPPNPAELLNSGRMHELLAKAKERFDIILLDTPPVLAVIDAVIVSSITDSTIFVIKAGKTSKKALATATGEVRKTKADLIGVVFNEVKLGARNSGLSYYHYYQYRYASNKMDYSQDKKTNLSPAGDGKEVVRTGKIKQQL